MRLSTFFAPLAFGLLLSASPALAATFESGEYGSISLDASILVDVAPDVINVGLACSLDEPLSRSDFRRQSANLQKEVQQAIGTSGRVRKSGTPSMYDHYDFSGVADGLYTGSVNLLIRNMNPEATSELEMKLEDIDCVPTWDVRVLNVSSIAREYKEELLAQINEKKAIFEEMLGKKLNKVSNISFYGAVDGGNYAYYGSNYDSESNTVSVLATLNITFDFGTPPAK